MIAASSAPRVLLAVTNRWGLSARLAMSLVEAGCSVHAVCPAPGHPLTETRAVQRVYSYSGLRPLRSLVAAIEACDPDIVIPSCDRSVEHLHSLHRQAIARGEAGRKTASLIERSLGSPSSYPIVSSRYELLATAQQAGIRVPRTSRLDCLEDLESWEKSEILPWMMKADGSWGGNGVRIVRTAAEARQFLAQLGGFSTLSRAIKRVLVNRDWFWLLPWWHRSRRAVIAQACIEGRPANCTAVCWQGRLLAAIAVEVVCSEGATGPASVVRLVDNPEMMRAAEKIASQLGLSGFFGLDFMIENNTEAAYLIEMNPRTTPPCHLRLERGRDLAGALTSCLAGELLPERARVTEEEFVAYFPHGVSAGEALSKNCYRDIPRAEPELVKELLNPFPDRTILFRLVQHLSGVESQTLPEVLTYAASQSAESASGFPLNGQDAAINSSLAKAPVG